VDDELRPGDVLSYSAGSTRRTPDGYRFVRRSGATSAPNMLLAVATRWPEVLERLQGRPPLIVNAYPATLGEFVFGIAIDTYLSPRTASRALWLAQREGLTAVLLAQPLFAAELLFGHRRSNSPWPTEVVLATGGYCMPETLEQALTSELADAGSRLSVIHFYGAAEVDAGCMLARRVDGRLVYYPRGEDVSVTVDGGHVLLAREQDDGTWSEPFRTGDTAVQTPDGGFELVDPPGTRAALARLNRWTRDDWLRRTGWMTMQDGEVLVQVRPSLSVTVPEEIEYHEFARLAGMTWLDKPRWLDLPVAA
jgi:hypothetical protein